MPAPSSNPLVNALLKRRPAVVPPKPGMTPAPLSSAAMTPAPVGSPLPSTPPGPFAGATGSAGVTPNPPAPSLGSNPGDAAWMLAQQNNRVAATAPGQITQPAPVLANPVLPAPARSNAAIGAESARLQGMADMAALGSPAAHFGAAFGKEAGRNAIGDPGASSGASSGASISAIPTGGGGFGPFGSFEQWQSAFAAEHGGRPPNEQDVVDAQASFDFVAQTGKSPTEKEWLRRYYSGYWPGGVEEAGGSIYQQMTGGNVMPPDQLAALQSMMPGGQAGNSQLPPGWTLAPDGTLIPPVTPQQPAYQMTGWY